MPKLNLCKNGDRRENVSKGIRDENIRQGNTELDTETLHGLQEAYLIANHMSWLKSLSENLKKATENFARNPSADEANS